MGLTLGLVALSILVILLSGAPDLLLLPLWGLLVVVAVSDLMLSRPARQVMLEFHAPATGYTGLHAGRGLGGACGQGRTAACAGSPS